MEIKYYNRSKGIEEKEQVYGEGAIKLLYTTKLGKAVSSFLAGPGFSKFYGGLQDSVISKQKVKPFIDEFDIDMSEYLPEDGRSEEDPFSTFNNFFIRRFRPGKREFDMSSGVMPAFAEARYLGFETVNADHLIPVKGKYLSPRAMLQKREWEDVFAEGPMLIARLCPVDYHRYHYPDNGTELERYAIHGEYHSVNPMALKYKDEIFCANERTVSILETENFGKLAYVEVGAMCVGRIVQSHKDEKFQRGDEKGYFLFGGSTVIVMGEKGRWVPSEDILKYSHNAQEVYIKLGDQVATKV